MKIATIVTFLMLIINSNEAFAQLKETIKTLKKVNEQLYACHTEVSNKQYAYFLANLKTEKDINALNIAQIDSLQWRSKGSFNEPYVAYYHKHKAYENYPVVNISHQAAIAYCNWLTKLYNGDEKRKFKKVQFRLPTVEEWEIAAKGNSSNALYPWEDDKMQTKEGKMRANFKRGKGDMTGVAGYLNENADITAPVDSYWPNSIGLYNMAGNVAEMTSNANTVKGGSWIDSAEQLQIANNQPYDGSPKSFIGFRCFMEIVEK